LPVNRLIALKNLPVLLALIIVPDLAAWLREHGLDRQQETHLPRLEDASLRVDDGDALAVKDEAGLQLVRRQVGVNFDEPSDVLEGSHADECVAIDFIHAGYPCLLYPNRCATSHCVSITDPEYVGTGLPGTRITSEGKVVDDTETLPRPSQPSLRLGAKTHSE
jgi:hypothetical protein